MRIAGLQKLTLLDYPEHMAATLFCPGCDLRCPFCHNASLVIPGCEGFPTMDLEEIRSFLRKRRGILDGVCITGGEPLLQPDIAEFCAELKDMGFAVKLDTNGTFPATLEHLIERGLVDYVAMDVKAACDVRDANGYAQGDERGLSGFRSDMRQDAPLCSMSGASPNQQDGASPDARRFARVTGIDPLHAPSVMEAMGESIAILLKGNVPYEFRTTVVRELHDEAHLRAIAQSIRGTRAWYLQGFVDSEDVIGGAGTFHAYSADQMHELAESVRPIIPSVEVRGVD